MKVTFIAPFPPLKSISPYCLHLARAISEKVKLTCIGFKRITPEAFYSGGTQDDSTRDCNIKNTETKVVLSISNPFSWLKVGLQYTSGEIVHIQHWQLYSSIIYCFILPLLKLKRKKILISVHNITPHETKRYVVITDKILNMFIFRFADAFIVHNKRNKNRLMELYGIKDDKIFITGHGVIQPDKICHISKIDAREQLQISTDKKILLFFGYVWRYKGLDILLQSLADIKKEVPNIQLLIVGQTFRYWGSWKYYEKIIKKYNLFDYVITKLEYIPESEIEPYFGAADLVVLPYKEPFDTHGGVGALVLGFKKPMVVSDIGGLPEYVKDRQAIVNPDDVTDLSKTIINIFKNKNLYEKLTQDSVDLSKELTWEKIAKKTVEVYKKLMK